MADSDSDMQLRGELVGLRLEANAGKAIADVVHVLKAHKPLGPAVNAYILIERGYDPPRGRYISWINYFDVEYAKKREAGLWALVEPAESYQVNAAWYPYGWPECTKVPVIGDATLDDKTTSTQPELAS